MKHLLALALFVSSTVLAAEPARVIIVKSADLSAYASVVAGFRAEVRGAVAEVTLSDDAEAAEKAFNSIKDVKPDLVFAVGPLAANTARRVLSDIPVIFAMVPYYERYGLEASNVTGISLNTGFTTDFTALKAISPGLKRVGILHDPRYSEDTLTEARKTAEKEGLKLVPLEVDNAARVERVLQGARQKVDAMLMVADKTVGNAAVVKQLIRFSEAQRLPLVGLSPSQVKEGAFLSLAPLPLGIGQQAGRLANRVVHERVAIGALAVTRPEVLELSVNLSTAARLGGESELSQAVLKYAAQKGYALKVFE